MSAVLLPCKFTNKYDGLVIMTVSQKLKIGFLISRYPSIPHTFILREMITFRADPRFEIWTASLNQPDRVGDRLTEEEWHESKKTLYIKSKGPLGVITAFTYFLTRSPLKLIKAFFFGLSLGKTDVGRTVFSIFYFCEALVLSRWMFKRKIQHLHVHFATPTSTIALLCSQLTGKSFSMTIHGQEEFFDVSLNLMKEKIKYAAFICCVGYYPMSQLMRLVPATEWGKFSLTRVGVVPSLYIPSPPRDTSPFKILCVARLISGKGQYLLIEAFAKLVDEQFDLELTLVGDGPERETLEGLISTLAMDQKIKLTGALSEPEVLAELRKTDLFVLPSFSEGVSVAIMEAMAMAIPVIACTVSAVPELIEHYRDGILVPPGDKESLYNAMKMLIQNDELRHCLGDAGRKKIEEKYDIIANAETFAEVLRDRLLPNKS